MNAALRRDADVILRSSLNAVLPDEAVRRALRDLRPGKGRVLLVAAGKAAWQMAHAAVETLGRVDGGVVVTKYGHVKGEIPGVACYEAGHPVPDANGFAATQKALELVQGLTAGDTVLFLLSGGGSALFEQPLVPGQEAVLREGGVKAGGLYLAYAADNRLRTQPVQPVHVGGKAVKVGAANRASPKHVGDECVHGRRLAVELRQQAQTQRRRFEFVGVQGGQKHARQDLLAPKFHPAPLLSDKSTDIIAHNASLAIQILPKEVNYL